MSSNKMPVLFIGHGSPMNAIETNAYTKCLNQLGASLKRRPKAILCVSAHWMSEGTWITHMDDPKTIHDFYGFPQALFDVEFPAPSDPKLAEMIAHTIKSPRINLDSEMWGFDHGTWSVLRHMFPENEIPVLQLSIYMEKPSQYHFELGESLKFLRQQGVLIVGSGNIVHNLRTIQWRDPEPFDWAVEFDTWVKEKLETRDFESLVHKATDTEAGRLSIPTPDHWFPMLYVLGASDPDDKLEMIYDEMQNGSISMRSFGFFPQ
jgi:4,5-DOPA dioxygenase extradiol